MGNLDGLVTAFVIVGGLIGAAIMAVLFWGVPWLWELVKPFIHGWTA